MADFLAVLERTALFDGLDGGEIDALCRSLGCRRAYYERGSVILKRGARVRSAGIVLSGTVQAERNGADGSLVAAEDAAVLFVPLDALMSGEGAALTRVRLNLLSELSEKYWAQSERLALLRLPTLRAKLSRLLLNVREEQGGDRVRLSGTRETLAAELGVNRSALSRELGNMRRDGLLSVNRAAITLLDVAALQKNAGE